MEERIKTLEIALGNLAQQHQNLQRELQKSNDNMEALARRVGYEFSQDLKRWVKAEVMKEFKKQADG